MPVYNAEPFLREAIESILNQTYKDFEFIIINDGSTDNSKDIILSYNDKRIKYVENECNLKLIKTLNKGIDLAQGEYIARMDSDDISLPDRFERQMKVFSSNPCVDFINGRAYNIDEKGQSLNQVWYGPVTNECIKYINLFQSIICHPSIMIKAEILKKYKYRDDKSILHIEDYDLWARLFNDGFVCYSMKQPVLKYRVVKTSITHQKVDEIFVNLYVHINSNLSKYGIQLSLKEIKTLYGYNPDYHEMQSVIKKFNLFIDKNIDDTNTSLKRELNNWIIRMQLRMIKKVIKDGAIKDKLLTASRILVPNLIGYLRYLQK